MDAKFPAISRLTMPCRRLQIRTARIPVAVADFDDPASIAAALDSAERAYLVNRVPPMIDPERAGRLAVRTGTAANGCRRRHGEVWPFVGLAVGIDAARGRAAPGHPGHDRRESPERPGDQPRGRGVRLQPAGEGAPGPLAEPQDRTRTGFGIPHHYTLSPSAQADLHALGTFVRSLFHAVVVPSGLRTRVQPWR